MSKVERLRSSHGLLGSWRLVETAQPGNVVVGLRRVVDGLRPDEGSKELQPAGSNAFPR